MSKRFQTGATNVNNSGRKTLDAAGRDRRVSDIWAEGGSRLDDRPGPSIWGATVPGYHVGTMGGACHTLHEDNVRDFLAAYASIEPCDCESCRRELIRAGRASAWPRDEGGAGK